MGEHFRLITVDSYSYRTGLGPDSLDHDVMVTSYICNDLNSKLGYIPRHLVLRAQEEGLGSLLNRVAGREIWYYIYAQALDGIQQCMRDFSVRGR